jgi:excisionase family DNA binding protein
MASELTDGTTRLLHRPNHPRGPTEYVLGPDEVARILDCNPRDVSVLARKGELRARKLGSCWRFRHADVLAYLRGKTGRVASSIPSSGRRLQVSLSGGRLSK